MPCRNLAVKGGGVGGVGGGGVVVVVVVVDVVAVVKGEPRKKETQTTGYFLINPQDPWDERHICLHENQQNHPFMYTYKSTMDPMG